MAVVMIVRTSPDAARAEKNDANDPHQPSGDTRVGQDGVMLLVVINDEKPQHQQAAQNAANEFPDEMEVPMGACHRSREKGHGRKNMPPTFDGRIMGILLRRGNQFRTGSQVLVQLFATVSTKNRMCRWEGRKMLGVRVSRTAPSAASPNWSCATCSRTLAVPQPPSSAGSEQMECRKTAFVAREPA